MKKRISILILFCLFIQYTFAQAKHQTDLPKLKNPMTVAYLQKHLTKQSPRLVLNKKIEKQLKKQLHKNPVLKNMYQAVELSATEILKTPLLKRKMTGKRLLSVSRKMLYRMNVLGMVYRIKKEQHILDRINEEVLAVCQFSDWNPTHYLDVAEMAMAVAIAVDWTSGDLPHATLELAKKSLIEKGILPSYDKNGNVWWIKGNNNWNQVCHGGLIAASIIIAEDRPDLAAKTLHRALEGMPYALIEYGPDGIYPEGSTYWKYGTSFTVLTISMLESAFGTDFGLSDFPAFKESAYFRALSNAPSGLYFNFADCGDKRSENGDLTLAWFATKMNNALFFEKERFLRPVSEMKNLDRWVGAGLVWLATYEAQKGNKLPTAWKGAGENTVVFFRDNENETNQYYLGAKGGKASVNHGNMDAGSFVFELDGTRWAIDPGNQNYHELEKTGFKLWGRCQECERWRLLTKNNFGHNTLTINGEMHRVDGLAHFIDFKNGKNPQATLDLSPVFEGYLVKANRHFIKDSPRSLTIKDELVKSAATQMITWQLMTTAEVIMKKGGAILKKDGKTLHLDILSHPDMDVSIISLAIPPDKLDKKIENLKRIEISYPAYLFEDDKLNIKVRLSGTDL